MIENVVKEAKWLKANEKINKISNKEYTGDIRSWKDWIELKEQGYTSVAGYFNCSRNNLTSLKGAPKSVGGNFACAYNKLTSLEGAPQKVGGDLLCSSNKLISLKGAPKSVGGKFMCSYNNLMSLEGAPQKVGGNFYCINNKVKFTEDDVKAVSKVGGQIKV